MDVKAELQGRIKGEAADDEETLSEYSRDASLFEVAPRLVVFPKDAEDVKELVRFVNRHPGEKLSLTCRSGGTDMTGGPLGESIVVDVSRHMNRLKELGEGYAVAEPGMFYRDFDRMTRKKRYILPSYPASREICTVGGMVANNSGGEKTLRYGKTEQYVQELRMVCADGEERVFRPLVAKELEEKKKGKGFEAELYRTLSSLVGRNEAVLKKAKPKVSKNSAGYYLWNVAGKGTFDLTRVISGSQGTLGIITEIRFGLVRPAPARALLVIFLKDMRDVAHVVAKVLRHEPESFETYDDHTLTFALRHLGDFVRLLKGNIVTLAIRFLPEFAMYLLGGFSLPKLVMLAEFTGDGAEEAKEKAEWAKDGLEEFGVKSRVTRSEREAEKYFVVRRESFNLLRHHVKGKRTAPFIDDIIVRPERLPEFFPRLKNILDEYPKLTYTITGHIGDGNFHIIPLMNLETEQDRGIIPELSAKVYDLVFAYGGSMTAEHNDGIIRSHLLGEMYGQEVFSLFEETKKAFDPNGIFNPGKKVGGSKEYMLSHIASHN